MTEAQMGTNARSPEFSGRVWRKNGFIQARFSIEDGRIRPPAGGGAMEAAYIVPPFADPHLHGGWGAGFRKDGFAGIEKRLTALGVMFAIPTLENSMPEDMRRTAADFQAYRQDHPDTIFPFLRVEGPFISSAKKGFQRAEPIQEATEKNIREFLSIPEIGIFTFAPEIPNTDQLARLGLACGRIPSVGHSRAALRDLYRVYERGVRHLTHYPNAMSGCHHREIGLTGAGLLIDDLQLEIIADGIHTADDFLDLVLKVRGPDIALTSDMIPPALSRRREFDGRTLTREGRKLTLPEGVLAGGSTPVPDQVARLFDRGVSPEFLVPMACLNTRIWFDRPAPGLEEGAPADFCCLDKNMRVTAVFRRGRRLDGEARG